MLDMKLLGDGLAIFSGGDEGEWRVISMRPVKGEGLPRVERVAIRHSLDSPKRNCGWSLLGVASHVRYVERGEKEELAARQETLGRVQSTRAALIPLRKSLEWWQLAQDQRREIFEAQSHHIEEGVRHLPAVARQLYHSRDLGEPFDFLTWFEYEPSYSDQFEALVQYLRTTEEWKYVDREVDIRLSRE